MESPTLVLHTFLVQGPSKLFEFPEIVNRSPSLTGSKFQIQIHSPESEDESIKGGNW
jgi:hypothetical protein